MTWSLGDCTGCMGDILRGSRVVKLFPSGINWTSFMLGDSTHSLDFILTESPGANFSDSNFQDEVTDLRNLNNYFSVFTNYLTLKLIFFLGHYVCFSRQLWATYSQVETHQGTEWWGFSAFSLTKVKLKKNALFCLIFVFLLA